jgi:hypothetical protein
MRTILTLIGLGLLAFGPAALFAPELSANAFGLPADTAEARAYLYAAATRDVALGAGLLAALALGASHRVLAGLIFAMAIVAAGDAINVLAHQCFMGLAPLIHIGSLIGLLVVGGLVWRAKQLRG